MGSTTYSIRPDARPCFTWDSSPQDRCCMASEAECASHSVSTGKTLVSWEPLFHSPLSDTWLKWTLILLIKTVFLLKNDWCMLTILWVQYILRVNQGILGTILKVDWRETETHQQCMPGTQTTSTCGVGPKTIFLQVIFLVQCAPSLSLSVWFSLSLTLSLASRMDLILLFTKLLMIHQD